MPVSKSPQKPQPSDISELSLKTKSNPFIPSWLSHILNFDTSSLAQPLQIDAIIQAIILIAIGLTPLLFSQRATELFEFPKMILIYILALLALTLIISKWLVQKQITFIHSSLTWPTLIFILWLVLTSLTSLNLYTSIAGYYSRFNGGLASYVAYIILGYATLDQLVISSQLLVLRGSQPHSVNTETSHALEVDSTNSPPNSQSRTLNPHPISFLRQILWAWLISAILTSIWAVLEHFGHDPSCIILRGTFTANCWVEDVQARVFSTFGQPNWLATYLVATLPIGLYLVLTSSTKWLKILTTLATVCCYAAFWYTYSRSGWFGLIAAIIVIVSCLSWQLIWAQRRWLLAIIIGCIIVSATSFNTAALRAESSLSGYGSDTSTGSIRLLVWQGTAQLIQRHPLLGTGLGTFAYSFLPYRPAAMNTTTEWNFLYNEAHNQVLNTAATIGIPGLIIWLSLLAIPLLYALKSTLKDTTSNACRLWFFVYRTFPKTTDHKLKTNNKTLPTPYALCPMPYLAASIIGVFVSQLFGFAVVVTNLLLFISLAIIVSPQAQIMPVSLTQPRRLAVASSFLVIVAVAMLLFRYTSAELLVKQASASTNPVYTLQQVIQDNPWEPNYRLQLAAAYINSTTTSNQTINYRQADQQLKIASQLNPHDLVVSKSLGYYYQTMATIDSNYQASALQFAHQTFKLAPTDAEACQRLGDLQLQYGQKSQALSTFNQLIILRPVAESYFHQAKWYQKYGTVQQYQNKLQHVLHLDPNFKDAQTALQQLNTAAL